MNYECYGLTFASEILLPELINSGELSEQRAVDVYIRIASVTELGLAESEGRQLSPYLWVGDSELWLHVPGVARFLVREGREILIDPDPSADQDSIRLFLMGAVLAAILYQRGFLVLHGNAIRIGDACLICVGESGAGKSTLAAAFVQRGYTVLADDVVPIDANCHALPGMARIKLWQDTADRFGIDTRTLRRIRPNIDKFNYAVPSSFCAQPLPVRWIYALNKHSHAHTIFEPVTGMEQFRYLHGNTYRGCYLDGMKLRAEHLKSCGQLAAQSKLVRLTRPEHGFEIDTLVDNILSGIDQH